MAYVELEPTNIAKILEKCPTQFCYTVISQCKSQRFALNILYNGRSNGGTKIASAMLTYIMVLL
jgi:hypothetical protein